MREAVATIAQLGQAICRVEDARLLAGEGHYVDDLTFVNMAHSYVLRSPLAHARILRLDCTRAKAHPGVLLVLTDEDSKRDGIGDISCPSYPNLPPETRHFRPEQPVLARNKVRHVGDRVAFVVAETREQAREAAELIDVEYEALPPVPNVEIALQPGASKVWDEAADNICFPIERGSRAEVDTAFADAFHVSSMRIHYPRASANPMEPRAAIGRYDRQERRLTLHSGSPQPHRTRQFLSQMIFGLPESSIRVVTQDVGGGFGMRGTVYPEDILVLWAARRLGKPVKWRGDRTECMLSDMHGRDQLIDAQVALDKNGRILALRAKTLVNVGAYLVYSASVPPTNAATTLSGAYDIPLLHADVKAVFTTTNPLGPYRGSGRPETTFLLERLMEQVSREMKIDTIELRRRNLISSRRMPYKMPGGWTMDCGDLDQALDMALEAADAKSFAARRKASEERGRLRGLGYALHAENAAHLSERMSINVDPSGSAIVYAGTVSSGQGHETIYKQMVSGWLNIPMEHVRILYGDTDKVPFGRGSFAARTAVMAGSALRSAADDLIRNAGRLAGWLLKSENEMTFQDGIFHEKGTNRSIDLKSVAKAAYAPNGAPIEFGIGLDGHGKFEGPQTYPYGCMACEVEVDPETGATEIMRFIYVDDVGVAINPMIVKGQTLGSIVQAAGQVLLEEVIFDPETGENLTATFLDYAMPRANLFPKIEGHYLRIPTKSNPLGVKGGSETGSFGAPAAIINSIVDALSPLGVTSIDLPATPERVWRAIQEASARMSPRTPYSV